jgi:hypothetical protein
MERSVQGAGFDLFDVGDRVDGLHDAVELFITMHAEAYLHGDNRVSRAGVEALYI